MEMFGKLSNSNRDRWKTPGIESYVHVDLTGNAILSHATCNCVHSILVFRLSMLAPRYYHD
eukprot:3233210-Karenia_brevis.AAC.1